MHAHMYVDAQQQDCKSRRKALTDKDLETCFYEIIYKLYVSATANFHRLLNIVGKSNSIKLRNSWEAV